MATRTTNTFSKSGDTIYIKIEKAGEVKIAQTTYREDYYEELQKYIWSINADGYPTNATLGGGLHRYVIGKWYGEDTLKEFTDKGFVVDHMNCKLRSNGMPVPLLRNGYSIFNGTKCR